MLSDGVLIAIVVSALMAPLHLVSTLGVLFLRKAPAFAVRVPKLGIFLLSTKVVSYAFMAWLLIDVEHCPCAVVPFVFWLDWLGNVGFGMKTVILLFRYEIQAALKKSKEEASVIAFDSQNFFVRYRSLLKTRTQVWVLLAMGVYLGVGNMIVLGVFWEFARAPCTKSNFLDNNICLGCLCFAWMTAGPMIATSTWASVRLKKFPHDNWRMGTESTLINAFSTVGAIACATVLIVVPTFDGILWVLMCGALGGNLLHLAVPLTLHRRTLAQLAKLDLKSFTSLDHLLQNNEFLEVFGNFLRKEFSSENLFFWLEVKRMRLAYKSLMEQSQVQEGGSDPLLMQAAADCQMLGSRCIGNSAPWQLNVSGFTAQELETSLSALKSLAADGSTEAMHGAVIETLQTFNKMQFEVYELLRKDPYPRFLVTTEAKKLNQDENFKRMIAAETLEDEVQASLGSIKHATTDGSSKGGSSSTPSDGSKNVKKRMSFLPSVDDKDSSTSGSSNGRVAIEMLNTMDQSMRRGSD